MLYESKLGHNIVEATKNICCAKGEGAVDHSTITRWFKKFCSSSKNQDHQAKPGRPNSMDSEAMLQVIEANLVSSIWRVSGKLDISQSSGVHYLHDLGEIIWSC